MKQLSPLSHNERLLFHDLRKGKVKPAASAGTPAGVVARCLLDDAQVLECRSLHEFHGWKSKRLADRYGVRPAYMVKLLSYSTRSKLIPKPEDAAGVVR